MSIDADDLLTRLPAFFATRDADTGGSLRALLAVIAEQAALLEADIDRQHDNAFIETCEDWLVPYLGDLVGAPRLQGIGAGARSGARAQVANALRLRRRKGTLPALEQACADASAWRVRAVEMFRLVQTTQHLALPRPQHHRTPDLRRIDALHRVGGAFDQVAHSATVRAMPGGRHALANIALFVWRLQAYPVQKVLATPDADEPGSRYHIDPLCRALQLFNRPLEESAVSAQAGPLQAPEALTRRVLAQELNDRRQALADGLEPTPGRFGQAETDDVIRVWVDDRLLPPEDLVVCDLRKPTKPGVSQRRPPEEVVVPSRQAGAAAMRFPRLPDKFLVGIDPVLGRLALPAGKTAKRIEVSFAYGFPGDLGAGPYDRRAGAGQTQGLLQAASFAEVLRVPGTHATLAKALAAVKPGQATLIEWDCDSAEKLAPVLNLPGAHLAIQAVNRRRPVLDGGITLSGDAATRLSLSGLWLTGSVALTGPLLAVTLRHCTLAGATGAGAVTHSGNAPGSSLCLHRCIVGGISAAGELAGVDIGDSVLDGRGTNGAAAALAGTPLRLRNVTVLGALACGTLEASNSLFMNRVQVDHRQQGCVRYSWIDASAQTPRRFRCQPEMATAGLPALAAEISARLTPSFTSLELGHPAFAQLARGCAAEVVRGADDGAEMGAWNLLRQAQREDNLRRMAEEQLRCGLDFGVFFAN